ncbi:MAG: hypothetical protein QXD11_00350 [Candidatus Micrarchaeaceae archaeon]
MTQILYLERGRQELSKKEELIILEIDKDKIDSASMFVEYMQQSYNISKSTLWHNLIMLKEKGILDLASRETPGKPLMLTQYGISLLSSIKSKKQSILSQFSIDNAIMLKA